MDLVECFPEEISLLIINSQIDDIFPLLTLKTYFATMLEYLKIYFLQIWVVDPAPLVVVPPNQ